MMEKRAKITSKGQVTIPKKIREKFGMTEGEEIIFTEDELGRVRIKKKIDNPYERLRELRKEFNVSSSDVKKMIRESKEDWAKRDIH